MPSKFKSVSILTYTAWCVPTCLVRPSSMIAQLPRFCLSRRCLYNTGTLNFKPGRGQCPEARRTSDHVFARREGMKVFLEGVPRKRGSGGGMTVSARFAKALTGSQPPAILSCLSDRSERHISVPIKHHQSKPEKLHENGQNFLKKHLDTHGGVDVSYWSPC